MLYPQIVAIVSVRVDVGDNVLVLADLHHDNLDEEVLLVPLVKRHLFDGNLFAAFLHRGRVHLRESPVGVSRTH